MAFSYKGATLILLNGVMLGAVVPILSLSDSEMTALAEDDACNDGADGVVLLQHSKGSAESQASKRSLELSGSTAEGMAPWDNLGDVLDSAKNAVGDAANQAQQAAAAAVEQGKAHVRATAEDALQKAGEAGGDTLAKASQAAQAAFENGTLGELDDVLADAASKAVSNITVDLKEVVKKAQDGSNVTEDLIAQVSAASKQAMAAANGAAEDALSKLNGTVGKVAAKYGLNVTPVMKKASESLDDVEERLQEKATEVEKAALEKAESLQDAQKQLKILDDIDGLNVSVQGGISKVEDSINGVQENVEKKFDAALESLPDEVKNELHSGVSQGVAKATKETKVVTRSGCQRALPVAAFFALAAAVSIA
eukprot:TRINITY_DN42574_c0_g1_i1.p1 TRINITY_DN42574_c0_g1~~TRINITY_DN42574_c0_g1_i1.p1  ORF type:complete len:367 (-),score=129.93 TRINITY_DN42574_c0_g1_i1:121-1221(-)